VRRLVQRIIRIVIAPQAEWARVATERGARRALLHAGCLALVPALAAGSAGAAWRALAVSALALPIVSFGLWLASRLYARGARFADALKLAAYGATPLWLAYAPAALPAFALVPLIGLVYALYLIDAGAPAVLGVGHGDSAEFTAVAVLLSGSGLWAAGAAAAASGLL
jgi:hypothetical protein